MKKNFHSKFNTLLAILVFLGLSVQSALACAGNDPSSPGNVTPVFVPGNPTLCSGGFRIDPATSGTYNLSGGTITVTVTNSSCGPVFSWSVSAGVSVNEIVVKGGPDANRYTYSGAGSDGNLHAPLNSNNNKYYGLSHIDVCYSNSPAYELTITKTVQRFFKRKYIWHIDKYCLGPDPLVLEPGQVFDYPFMVETYASHDDSNWRISGDISVYNTTPVAAVITGITDLITPGNIPVTANCNVSFPHTLQPGQSLGCSYSINLPNGDSRTNTATVTTSTPNVLGNSASVNFHFVSPTEVEDECGYVWEVGGNNNPMEVPCYTGGTLYYSSPISFEDCGSYEYTATSYTRGSDTNEKSYASCGFTVEVPCEEEGCTRTIGYWSTHSSYGPASYDPTWGLIGENTGFFLSGKTYYQVMWTPPAGNSYYILAPQYVAAQLNQLAGAAIPPAVLTAFNTATSLLSTYTPAQVKSMNPNNPVRQQFNSIAAILDDYNNGITGPGHCEENNSAGFAGMPDALEGEVSLSAQPNPFAETAEFTLSVPYDSPVTLDVFNANGQKMATLFSAFLEAGQERTVSFDGTYAPQGLYIYRLTTDREVKSGQLIKAK